MIDDLIYNLVKVIG